MTEDLQYGLRIRGKEGENHTLKFKARRYTAKKIPRSTTSQVLEEGG